MFRRFPSVNLLKSLGFTIHPNKLVLVPTQEISFLGFITDSVRKAKKRFIIDAAPYCRETKVS